MHDFRTFEHAADLMRSAAVLHVRVLEDFLQAIQQNRAPACDGIEGRRSLALIEAIYRAAKTPDRVATV